MGEGQSDGWAEWRRHVLIELEEHRKALKECTGELHSVRTEVAMLKVKSSLWGAGAGALTVILTLLVGLIAGWAKK
jgi:hypothetical protein